MVMSSVIMYVSEGSLVRLCAVMAGSSWGAAATVDPVLCSTVGGPHQATLYAMGKVMGMLVSMLWIKQAAQEVKLHTPEGSIDCIGWECFRTSWQSVVCITTPCLIVTLVWAAWRVSSRKCEHTD
eukprot:gnl/TRDRNA2_/TRDRNA2_206160_c0_seq1.p1 gnl/TRDRNA2_/TRDRNA2_206160_c0~~gnl/TRDRNA2_/TRDRNA2_206160_c0_seq1.p1  ORF type:complete len:125 (+),score=13.68 gnl/TRDRNA2_/TRDRNA2_206160_c0_seq1:228-602(+)